MALATGLPAAAIGTSGTCCQLRFIGCTLTVTSTAGAGIGTWSTSSDDLSIDSILVEDSTITTQVGDSGADIGGGHSSGTSSITIGEMQFARSVILYGGGIGTGGSSTQTVNRIVLYRTEVLLRSYITFGAGIGPDGAATRPPSESTPSS